MAETARLKTVVIIGDFAAVNGGQAKVAIDSARLLAEAGISVIFFAASGPVSAKLHHPNINAVCLGQNLILEDTHRARAMLIGLWNTRALRRLREVISPLSPETTVLHCHGWAKALSPSVGVALTRSEFPTLYTMHEYFLACPNGGFLNYQTGQVCHLKPLSAACCTTNCDMRHFSHKAWRVARTVLARTMANLPEGLTDVVFLSETQRRVMAPYLSDKTRLHALPNPVSAGGPGVDFRRNRQHLFVGRLSPEKGATIFAEACRKAGMSATFVGDGPDASRVREILPDAEITGWLDGHSVQRHLSNARSVVFPSVWYECQPLVPIEAQLRGIPVVCGKWSAAAETVRHGITGIVYEKPDADTLSQALSDVEEIEPFEATELAQRVSPEAHLRGLLDIYEGLLRRARPSPVAARGNERPVKDP